MRIYYTHFKMRIYFKTFVVIQEKLISDLRFFLWIFKMEFINYLFMK